MSANAYVVEAVRTAGGRRNGKLASWHPADLATEVLNRSHSREMRCSPLSHQRAAVAAKSGAFSQEIVPVAVSTPDGTLTHQQDEGILASTKSWEVP